MSEVTGSIALVIHARGLTQAFLTRKGREKIEVNAVAGIDIDVEPGEIVAFLGPNGAGKTTTLRMLTTLLRPTSGEATVAGFDLRKDPVSVRRNIGYVSQSGSTSQVARAGEEVVDHGLLYGLAKTQAITRGQELFGQLDLDGLWERQPNSSTNRPPDSIRRPAPTSGCTSRTCRKDVTAQSF